MGVAYYVRAYNDPFTDHGFLEISAGVSNNRVSEVVEVILAECKRLTTELVSPEELNKVKEYLAGNAKLELELSDAWATYFGGQEVLRKKIKTPEDTEKEIRKVTALQIRAVAREIFKNNRLNLALIGPFKDKKYFEAILKF
jgi:predicted Zn-dependent peptidase